MLLDDPKLSIVKLKIVEPSMADINKICPNSYLKKGCYGSSNRSKKILQKDLKRVIHKFATYLRGSHK